MKILRFVLLLVTASSAWAQRTSSYEVAIPPKFSQAITKGTRAANGAPGANYWMNNVNYTIEATLDPAQKRVSGTVEIRYTNNSPDELKFLVVQLRQNVYKPDAARNRAVETPTQGMEVSETQLLSRKSDGTESWNRVEGRARGTQMSVLLPNPLKKGESVSLRMKWAFTVPKKSFRMGHDDEVFVIAYWYPQIAVYDDVRGWDQDQYLGNGEFYMDFADYDVKISAPKGFLVTATGTLQNPSEVLNPEQIERLNTAMNQDAAVNVVTEADRNAGKSTLTISDGLTWHFKAQNVRDFTFAASDKYVWDAARAKVGDLNGDGQDEYSLVQTFYRPNRKVWQKGVEYCRFTIEDMSRKVLPYPWPHMTAFDGFIGGGMEFPMLTHIGNAQSAESLFGVLYHEIAHMWFPMMIGVDEKSFVWMEEGVTTFNENDGFNAYYPDKNAWDPKNISYYRIAGTGDEVEIVRHTDYAPLPARFIAAYDKPAVMYRALRGYVGEEKFNQAYRTYAKRWAFKHPYPYDFFNTFEDVLGMDLDWFWNAGFYTTWTMDHAVKSVETKGANTTVIIQDKGRFPMPNEVEITFADGKNERRKIPVEDWLSGKSEVKWVVKGKVKQVSLDPAATTPDADRTNNVWKQ